MARKKRVSIDATIEFQHEGEEIVVKMLNSVWNGEGMLYTWITSEGKTVETNGVPKDYKVIADVAPRYRK